MSVVLITTDGTVPVVFLRLVSGHNPGTISSQNHCLSRVDTRFPVHVQWVGWSEESFETRSRMSEIFDSLVLVFGSDVLTIGKTHVN